MRTWCLLPHFLAVVLAWEEGRTTHGGLAYDAAVFRVAGDGVAVFPSVAPAIVALAPALTSFSQVGAECQGPAEYLAAAVAATAGLPGMHVSVNIGDEANLHLPKVTAALRSATGNTTIPGVRLVANASTTEHLEWLSDHPLWFTEASTPLFWLPGAGCAKTKAVESTVKDIANLAPRGFILFSRLRRPQVSNRQPASRVAQGPQLRYRFTGGEMCEGAQEPTFAFVRSSIPRHARYVLYYPHSGDEEWALLSFSNTTTPPPPLPAAAAPFLVPQPPQAHVLLDFPSPAATVAPHPPGLHLPPYHAVSPHTPWTFGHDLTRMLPFTNDAQVDLFAQQHPRSCKGAQFVVLSLYEAGIGSLIHKISYGMAVAHQLGRVLLINATAGSWFAKDEEYCGGVGNLECFVLPLSNCTLDDLAGDAHKPFSCSMDGRQLAAARVVHLEDFGVHAVNNRVKGHVFNESACVAGLHHKLVPDKWAVQLHGRLHTSPHYWWRAQTATYILRFNEATRAFVVAARQYHYPNGFPPGTVSLHVRHGDKHSEDKLVPFQRYLHAAEAVLASHPRVAGEPPLGGRSAFLSTESPLVTAEARLPQAAAWTIRYLPVRRDNMPPAGRATIVGRATEFLQAVLQLVLAVECDAWVCTLSSNWCRLVDELRGTWGGKHHLRHRFLEVGPTEEAMGVSADHWYW